MAVTSTNKNYTPSAKVNAAEKQMKTYQSQKPASYKPSTQVTQAQQKLKQTEAAQPKSYSSKYGTALNGILKQIQNPKEFKYEFNGDELFKQYADLYTQKGRQASMDAMGQAAALTGGYGNSYAQQVGNQAYDQYLLNLYDKGLELRNAAYQQYLNDRQDLYNQYGTLAQQDQTDYGRYRDTVGDWQANRDYYSNQYNNERNVDYSMYRDAVSDYNNYLNYYTDMYNNERSFDYGQFTDTRNFNEQQRQYNQDLAEKQRQYNQNFAEEKRQYDQNYAEQQRQFNQNYAEQQRQYNATLAEQQRQFNANLEWDKMSNQQKYAAEYALQILGNGQMPTLQLLKEAGLSEEDAKKMMAQLEATAVTGAGGGGGGGGRGNGSTLEEGTKSVEAQLAEREAAAQLQRNQQAYQNQRENTAAAAAAAQTKQAQQRKANETYTTQAYKTAQQAAAAQTKQAEKRKTTSAARTGNLTGLTSLLKK